MDRQVISSLVFLLLFPTFAAQVDYIINGKFDNPPISANSYLSNCADNWTGFNFNLMSLTNQAMSGQYIDMQESLSMSGSIGQTVNLPEASQYRLNFSYRLSTIMNPHALKVLWNGVEYQSIIPDTQLIYNASLLLDGNAGANVLKFIEVGSSFNYGFYLDNVSLIQVKVNQISQDSDNDFHRINIESIVQENRVFFVSAILSTPLTQTRALRVLFMIADDFWLYAYNNRTYDGIISEILTTIMAIQLMKFECLDRALKLSSLKEHIPISNYTNYTMERIAIIQNSSSVLLDSNFAYFLYYCPENILACALMFFVFKLLQRTRFGKYFQMYGYGNILIAKALIQSNLSYLTFACWAHLSHPFSFKFFDKISFAITILLLLFVILYSFSSSFLVKVLLKQKSHFFRPFLNNSLSSFNCLTIKNTLRAFLKGTIFFFFHYIYAQQMLFLMTIQVLVVIFIICIESYQQIYKRKSAYICTLLYHIFLALFNFTLLLEELYQTELVDKKIFSFEDLKIILVYLTIFIIALESILDFLPKIMKRKGQRDIKEIVKGCKSTKQFFQIAEDNKNQNLSIIKVQTADKLERQHSQKKNKTNINLNDVQIVELQKRKQGKEREKEKVGKESHLCKNTKNLLVTQKTVKFVKIKGKNLSSNKNQNQT